MAERKSILDVPMRDGSGGPLLCSQSRSAVGSSRHMFLDLPEYAKYGAADSDGTTAPEAVPLKEQEVSP